MIILLWAYPAPRRMDLQLFWNADKNNSVQKLHGSCRSVKPFQKNCPGQGVLGRLRWVLHLRAPPSDAGFMENKYTRSLKGVALDPKFSYLSKQAST